MVLYVDFDRRPNTWFKINISHNKHTVQMRKSGRKILSTTNHRMINLVLIIYSFL